MDSSSTATATTTIHLLVLIHGMWGNPRHLSALEATITTKYAEPTEHGEELEVLVARTVKDCATYDGIDWGGERIAAEFYERVEELEGRGKKVTKLSVTGYSLGGLIGRYLIGILHNKGFFKDVEPVNFHTIATPHLGLLRYPSLASSFMNRFGPRILSKTGEQFYCQDEWARTGRPLVEVMADPDGIFYQGLMQFKHMRIYANAINDLTVPYCTAAIETKDVFAEYLCNGIQVDMNKEYEHIIDRFTLPDTPPPKPAALSREWFERLRPRPILPPAAQFRFPLNIIAHFMLPFLIFPLLLYILYRFSRDSRASRDRIKELESSETYGQRLAATFEALGREIENAAVDIAENSEGEPYPVVKAKLHPVVTPLQKKVAKWLNQLPFEKELAFFPRVRNSHAMIISRESHRFPRHKLGESVVKHWADHFVF